MRCSSGRLSGRRGGSCRSRSRRRCCRSRCRSLDARLPNAAPNHRHHSIDLHRAAGLDLDLGKRARCRRRNLRVHLVGRNLEQRLIPLHALAHLLQPLGDGAFKDRLTHLRHHDICTAATRRRSSRWCRRGRRSSLRRLHLLGFLRGFLFRWNRRCRGGRACCRTTSLANHCHHSIDLHRAAGFDLDLGKRARRRRRNLRVHLVGRNLEQRLIPLHAVPGLLQPLRDRPLEDRLAHLGHDDVCRHVLSRLPIHAASAAKHCISIIRARGPSPGELPQYATSLANFSTPPNASPRAPHLPPSAETPSPAAARTAPANPAR